MPPAPGPPTRPCTTIGARRSTLKRPSSVTPVRPVCFPIFHTWALPPAPPLKSRPSDSVPFPGIWCCHHSSIPPRRSRPRSSGRSARPMRKPTASCAWPRVLRLPRFETDARSVPSRNQPDLRPPGYVRPPRPTHPTGWFWWDSAVFLCKTLRSNKWRRCMAFAFSSMALSLMDLSGSLHSRRWHSPSNKCWPQWT